MNRVRSCISLCVLFILSFSLIGCGKNSENAVENADLSKEAISETITEIKDEAKDTVEEVSDAVEVNICSDTTFSVLQTNYNTTVEIYNSVVDLYEKNLPEGDEDIKAVLDEAASILSGIGELDQTKLTENDAIKINDSMIELGEALGVIRANLK